jgi:hypothetical protein
LNAIWRHPYVKGCSQLNILQRNLEVKAAHRLPALVNQGLATMAREQVKAGGKMIEVGRVRITAAGRRAIEG